MRRLKSSLANWRRSEEYEISWSLRRGYAHSESPIYVMQGMMRRVSQYTSNCKRGNDANAQKVNYVGNSTKSMHISVEASLKKLRTSYIDILYVHWWDYETSIPEVMDSLHNLVAAQKVLYLGISDTPAWVVSQANQYAVDHGKTPFVVYQGKWSILERSFEREIIPMARSLGMALSPFGVLGQGKLRTDEEEERRKETGEKGRLVWGPNWERNEVEVKVCKALEKVAAEVGVGSNITAGESESFSSIMVWHF